MEEKSVDCRFEKTVILRNQLECHNCLSKYVVYFMKTYLFSSKGVCHVTLFCWMGECSVREGKVLKGWSLAVPRFIDQRTQI